MVTDQKNFLLSFRISNLTNVTKYFYIPFLVKFLSQKPSDPHLLLLHQELWVKERVRQLSHKTVSRVSRLRRTSSSLEHHWPSSSIVTTPSLLASISWKNIFFIKNQLFFYVMRIFLFKSNKPISITHTISLTHFFFSRTFLHKQNFFNLRFISFQFHPPIKKKKNVQTYTVSPQWNTIVKKPRAPFHLLNFLQTTFK